MDNAYPVAALVEAAAHGDHAAWSALVSRYTPLVATVIRSFQLPRYDAEDVGQTVWLRLVEHLGKLREPRALPMWIITTTRNECLRLLKNSRRTRPFDPTGDAGEPSGFAPDSAERTEPDERIITLERHQMLLAAFAELPGQQRELMLLLIADPPVPYAEISRRLGMAIGSIGPTRARALQRLRECPAIADWHDSDILFRGEGGGRHDVAGFSR